MANPVDRYRPTRGAARGRDMPWRKGADVIDLKPFCGDDDYREYLNAPFSAGEFTYASNGHIMVRVPRRDDIYGDTKLVGACEKMFADNKPGDLVDIPDDLPQLKFNPCNYCYGKGKVDGETCEECNGAGKEPAIQGIDIGDTQFAARYLDLLKTLPNCKIRPNGKNPAPFTFDGGCGLLMPLRK